MRCMVEACALDPLGCVVVHFRVSKNVLSDLRDNVCNGSGPESTASNGGTPFGDFASCTSS